MKQYRSNMFHRSRAFSLIEVVIAVIVLAIAVPPTLNLMDSAGSGRADAINTTRATLLATSVLETITADINSDADGLGFDAFEDPSVYLDHPVNGLYARLDTATQSYTGVGLDYAVEISDLVASDGVVSGDTSENIFRIITVRVSFPAASSGSFQVPFSTMVSAL